MVRPQPPLPQLPALDGRRVLRLSAAPALVVALTAFARTAAALVAAALIVAATGCGAAGSRPAPAAHAAQPSVLIVVVDALRADRVGAYGYPLETTPTIDRLAADPDAVLFERHYVQGTWTKISTASLFTGLFAFQHGVMEGHEPVPGQQERYFTTQVLDDSLETLAERLKALSYATFGVTKSRHLMPEYGFAQGFTEFYGPHKETSDATRVARVLEIAGRVEAPFFGYLHLAGSHHPFPPSVRDEAFMRRHGFAYDERARMAAGVSFHTADIKHAINRGELRLEPDDVRFLGLVYDARTRKVDAEYLAELVEGLKRRKVYDDLLLVVTADHGEELYEHGGYSHGHALWNEVVHVPLVVKFPRGRRPAALPPRVAYLTRAIDVYPSLLAFGGHPVPPELPGEDVFDGTGPRFALAEHPGEWALVEGGDKLIEGKAGPRLYDLAKDPRETRDLAASDAARLETMRLVHRGLLHTVAVKPRDARWIETELDSGDVEALKGLGYLK